MRVEGQFVSKMVALSVGVAYAVAWYRIPSVASERAWLRIYSPAICLLFPAMLLLALYSGSAPWLNLVYFFAGSAIGVSVDALLLHSKVSRIAWSFEVISLCVFLTRVAVSATAIGCWINRKRQKAP